MAPNVQRQNIANACEALPPVPHEVYADERHVTLVASIEAAQNWHATRHGSSATLTSNRRRFIAAFSKPLVGSTGSAAALLNEAAISSVSQKSYSRAVHLLRLSANGRLHPGPAWHVHAF